MISGLHHYALEVPDLEVAEGFLQDFGRETGEKDGKGEEDATKVGEGTKFKLGGHDYGHTHVDWEKTDAGWRVAAVWICCQVFRIQAEERLLSQDVTYAEFKTRVRYRLVPYLY